MSIRSLDQWEKGYIAGVLDSDGAILIRRIAKTFSFYCYIQFVGTFEQMEKLKGMLGLDKKISQHGNRWTLQITKQDDVVSLLKRIYPFLTKKPEANLTFQMRTLHNRANSAGQRGAKPSEENIMRRMSIFRFYKQFKSRSGGHVTNWDEFEESLTDAYKVSNGNPEPSQELEHLLDKMTEEERVTFLSRLEGVTTRPEIMACSVPPEREEIV